MKEEQIVKIEEKQEDQKEDQKQKVEEKKEMKEEKKEDAEGPNKPIEVTFKFPKEESQVVSRVMITLGDKTIEAKVM